MKYLKISLAVGLYNQKYKVSKNGFNKDGEKPVLGKASSLLSFLINSGMCIDFSYNK